MDNWVINLGIALVAIISSFAVIKYMVSELTKNQSKIFERLDKHGDDIVALNTKSNLAMTSKDVDDKYVSKELFRQFEKHIDNRFDGIERGQEKILNFIEKVVKHDSK